MPLQSERKRLKLWNHHHSLLPFIITDNFLRRHILIKRAEIHRHLDRVNHKNQFIHSVKTGV